MSSPYVINEFINLLATASIPFYQTINERPGIPPAIAEWVTLQVDISRTERISLGTVSPRFRETGTMNAVILVKSGTGLTRGLTLSEEIATLFRDYAVGFLRVVSVQSATIFQPDEGNYFQVLIPVDYEYDFTY